MHFLIPLILLKKQILFMQILQGVFKLMTSTVKINNYKFTWFHKEIYSFFRNETHCRCRTSYIQIYLHVFDSKELFFQKDICLIQTLDLHLGRAKL